jgi:hypothetical protein
MTHAASAMYRTVQGTDVETSTPEAFRAYIKSQVAIFAEAIKASGAKVE